MLAQLQRHHSGADNMWDIPGSEVAGGRGPTVISHKHTRWMMDACLRHVHQLLGVPILWKMMRLAFVSYSANVPRTL